jgi:hypothetical protein
MHALPLLAAALLASMAGAQAEVFINEVLYDPVGTDAGLERIELKNIGPQTVNLFGSALGVCYPGTLLNNRTYWPFPTNFKIGPGQIVTVHYLQDGLDTATDYFTGASGAQFICVTPPKSLDNALGSVMLFKTNTCPSFSTPSNILDFVQWGGTTYHEVQAGAAGIWPFGASFKDVAEGHTIAYDGTGETPQDYFEDKSPTLGLYNEYPGSPFLGPFGAGCAGSGGVPALDSIGGPPAMGNLSFEMRIQHALAGAPALVALSATPLSVPLLGCTLEFDPAKVILYLGPKTVDVQGQALFSLPVPDDATLLAIPLILQGAVVDPASPSGLVAFSNAYWVVI